MKPYARVLGETVFAGVTVVKIAVMRVHVPLAINAGIRCALLPTAARGVIEIETD